MTLGGSVATLDLIVVTGVWRGVGQVIAQDLAPLGQMLLCLARTDRRMETAAAFCAFGGHAEALRIDLGTPRETAKAMVDWLKNRLYRRMVIALAAGTHLGRPDLYGKRRWRRGMRLAVPTYEAISSPRRLAYPRGAASAEAG